MRLFLFGVLALLTIGYVSGAHDLFEEEARMESSGGVRWASRPPPRHPEATLAAIRDAFNSGDYSNDIFGYLRRCLEQAPSFYQSPLLLAVYRANRLEEPSAVRRGFEAALRRFPANGRLHLTYAQWLLASRPAAEGEGSRELRAAKIHLRQAAFFEGDLVGASLVLLRWAGVPTEEWIEILPDTLPVRRQLIHTLAGAASRREALALLREILSSPVEDGFHAEAANWALQWGDPSLALEAARQWYEQERQGTKAGIGLARAALLVARSHLALGETGAAYEVFHQAIKEMEKQPRSSRRARVELLNGMGYEYLRMGQTVLACSLFLKARALAPYHAASSLGLARAFRRAGDTRLAVEHYRRVLELDGDNAEAKKELSELLLKTESARRGGE